MSDATHRDVPSRRGPLTPSGDPGGRLTVLAFLGSAAGILPIPMLPPRLLTRVRGAVVHDIAARRGLSLTHEARAELARASRAVSGGALLSAAMFLIKRSLRIATPLAMFAPAVAWIEVYALGLLLDRYFDRSRASSAVRIDEREARSIRSAIDRAVRRSLSLNLRPTTKSAELVPTEDLRDLTTRVSDGLLLAAAGLPTFVRKRLETAFDEVVGMTNSGGADEACRG
jgi:hypothetical protein